MKLRTLSFAKFPSYNWSDRKLNESDMLSKGACRKIIVVGQCDLHGDQRQFLALMDTINGGSFTDFELLETRGLITACNFGPYDNGHVVLGD